MIYAPVLLAPQIAVTADSTVPYACNCHCMYPHVTVVNCVAHSLDLTLEDIGKLPYFSDLIEAQKRIVRFITNHHYSLGLFRQIAQKLLKTGACLHSHHLFTTTRFLCARYAKTVCA